MLDLKLVQFVRALLFGHANYTVDKDNSLHLNLVIGNLRRDLEKHIDVQSTIDNGGLLQSQKAIAEDLNAVTRHIQTRNRMYFEKIEAPRDEILQPRTTLVTQFLHDLQVACRGDLENGMTANTYDRKTGGSHLHQQDEEVLRAILRNEPHGPFRDARFWGEVAERLLNGCRDVGHLQEIAVPNTYFGYVGMLYDVYCRSTGRVVHPLTLTLVETASHVDSVHWSDPRRLTHFATLFPDHPLSRTVRALLNSLCSALLNADPDEPALAWVSGEVTKFVRHVVALHDRIQRVEEDRRIPPRLVDVLHRVLAYAKLDHLWTPVKWLDVRTSKPADDLDLYTKYLALEKRVALLESIIVQNELEDMEGTFVLGTRMEETRRSEHKKWLGEASDGWTS